MKSFVFSLILILFFTYFIFVVVIYFYQRKLIYYPTAALENSFKKISLKNECGDLVVTVLNEGNDNAILYLGGNGETVDYNCSDFIHLLPEHTVYLMNYRGYGGSSGNPTEAGILSDSLLLFDTVSKNHKIISVIGRSLGSAVATYVASKRNIDKLVLITPFDSIESLAKEYYKYLPISLLLKDKYKSNNYVKNLKNETHILIAENDEIIPLKNTNILINSFENNKINTKIIKNTGHNTISYSNDFKIYLNSIFLTN